VNVLLSLLLCGTAWGQQISVSGTVTAADGARLRGATVQVQGTDIRTVTDANGRYSLMAPASGVLMFTSVGYRAVQVNIAGRTTVDAVMHGAVAYLEEVVVTGYTEQRRADITGAVASVNIESVTKQTTEAVVKGLDGRVSGVLVEATGSPGSRSTVRVRGVSSFQNNDPLYIVDGTPVQDTYVNFLNPKDIASIQVLKDASAASIYGSRASNGVIIIETTKRGAAGPPRVSVDVRTGVATPVRGYDDILILGALEYHEIVKRSYENAGLVVPTNVYGDPNNPTVPRYIWPNNCGPGGAAAVCSNVDESTYSFPNTLIMPGSTGTNWWDAVFSPAFVGDYNLGVSGGTDNSAYHVSFNYFNQEGTAAYNRFQRGSVRLNTAFNVGRLTVGENMAISREEHFGGLTDDIFGENNIVGKNIFMQPVIPVYDVRGYFASGKAVNLGNQTNPLRSAWEDKDNVTRNDRILGNVFAGLDVSPQFTLRTRFGFNLAQGATRGYNPIVPENSEPTFTNSIFENNSNFTEWTWSNTADYTRTFGRHSLTVLLGQEAIRATNRFIGASMANLITTDENARYLQDALGDASTKQVNSTGGTNALLSFFGKADYNFANRYHLSFTLRRDGSSRLGPASRWGTFPAVGLGWRLSEESFLAGKGPSNLMLRFGWGITGNQSIPSGRIVSLFGGGRSDTYYDIGGTNTTIVQGFRQTSLGNDSLKWEENRSTNAGVDVEFLGGNANLSVDVYQRNTENLLFDPLLPATAGVAAPPIVNIGKMRNRGLDISLGYRGTSWNVTLTGSHYKNKIVQIAGDTADFFYGPVATRFGRQVINKVGYPIGSFYGLVADGFFRDAADVAAHAVQAGAAPGRIKFRDVNGDGQISLADQTIIGSPHPDFTAGVDVGVRFGSWDASATVFGTFGNDIFDSQKEYYVFRNFDTNVRRDLLTDSWCQTGDAGCTTPADPKAKYPRLDDRDVFSIQVSSYYLEDGSYVRLRNLQIGYNVPSSWIRWIPVARVYLQAENLFTITGYPGLDPALSPSQVFGAAGDLRDQARGIDRGTYPSNRTFSLGLTAAF
jgi:TonB-linked SusC/RagA family outer membrane protein